MKLKTFYCSIFILICMICSGVCDDAISSDLEIKPMHVDGENQDPNHLIYTLKSALIEAQNDHQIEEFDPEYEGALAHAQENHMYIVSNLNASTALARAQRSVHIDCYVLNTFCALARSKEVLCTYITILINDRSFARAEENQPFYILLDQ